MFTYQLRPAHSPFQELLIELDGGAEPDELEKTIHKLLLDNGFSLSDIEDWWINDEIIYVYSNENGDVHFSRSIYDFFFILGTKNQAAIVSIDQLLSADPAFIRKMT